MNTEAVQPEVEEIAKAVGFAIGKWAEVEDIICGIYSAALRAQVYVTARDAFYSIVSFQAKIKITDACVKREFADQEDLLAEWAKFKRRSINLSRQRNELAHGSLQVVNTDPPTAGWFPFWNGGGAIEATIWQAGHVVVVDPNKFRHYSSVQIREMREAFAQVAAEGTQLYQKVAACLHAQGKKWNLGK